MDDSTNSIKNNSAQIVFSTSNLPQETTEEKIDRISALAAMPYRNLKPYVKGQRNANVNNITAPKKTKNHVAKMLLLEGNSKAPKSAIELHCGDLLDWYPDKKNWTRSELVVARMFIMAAKGNVIMIKEYFDRFLGKAKEELTIKNEGNALVDSAPRVIVINQATEANLQRLAEQAGMQQSPAQQFAEILDPQDQIPEEEIEEQSQV